MPSKILFCVLNWGLGHASRSVTVINKLLAENKEVVLASDGDALVLLQKEFPQLKTERLPAYNIRYSKTKKNFDKTIFLQLGKLTKVIAQEKKSCQTLIKKHLITEIISDNRYGCFHPKVQSTIICHQLTLQHQNRISQKAMNLIHHKMLDKFHRIWVPDDESQTLAGAISKTTNKKLNKKIEYIGNLSRLKKQNLDAKFELCILLSGPEPQRSILEKKLYQQASLLNKNIAFIRGISLANNTLKPHKNIRVFNLLESKELNDILNQSAHIVCRSGYSSIMDLVKLNKPATLIPTPGQTEQEYLAQHLARLPLFSFYTQEHIDLRQIFRMK